MAMSRKRARTAGESEEEGEAVPVADGFEAPIFGARVVGQVTTLALEGEDGPLASLQLLAVASDRAGGWYVTTKDSLLHVLAAGRSRTVVSGKTRALKCSCCCSNRSAGSERGSVRSSGRRRTCYRTS